MIWSRPLHLPAFEPNAALPTLHVDFETASALDLRRTGVYRYAEDPSTRVWCMAWGWDPCDIGVWTPADPFPFDVIEHVMKGGRVAAHNAQFERVVWNVVLSRRMGLRVPELQPEQMDCTMVRALAKSLPGALDDVAAYLGLAQRKDAEGVKVMKKLMKPRKPRKGEDADALLWHDTPENLAALYRYCVQDVVTEIAVDAGVAPLHPDEHRLWCLDQRINDRGFRVDVLAASRAATLIEGVKAGLDARMFEATEGAVPRCGQVALLTAFLADSGLDAGEGIAKDKAKALSAAAKEAGLDEAAEALALRAEYAKSSTAKLTAMLNSACEDLRARGCFQHHGASTGRWAGRLIQPQNMPRTKSRQRAEMLVELFDGGLSDAAMIEAVETFFPQPIVEVSNALRAMILARPGHTYLTRDFSNIEGRVNAWLADERWKIRAFEEYDTFLPGQFDRKGKPLRAGPDLYLLAYARSFHVDLGDVTDDQRQVGKVLELSMGYQGGVGAFQNMARVYGVRVTDERADELKRAWREANPAIVKSWWEYQDAIVAAVAEPGISRDCRGGRIRYLAHGGFLYCRLPSGRVLSYARPRIEWGVDTFGRDRREVRYEGYKVDKSTGARRWLTNLSLYGGLACENVVQAVARDILANAMFRCEARGWPIVMHVHDELVLELPLPLACSGADVDDEMTALPAWCGDMPMAVGGWQGERYRKD